MFRQAVTRLRRGLMVVVMVGMILHRFRPGRAGQRKIERGQGQRRNGQQHSMIS
jgi:hypothetical protein